MFTLVGIKRYLGVATVIFVLSTPALADPTRIPALTPATMNLAGLKIADALRAIASVGKFDVVVNESVPSDVIDAVYRDTAPLDAFYLTARMQQLRVKRVRWQEGQSRTCYQVSRPAKMEACYQIANHRVFRLQRVSAGDMVDHLLKVTPKDVNVGFRVGDTRDQVVVLGADDVLDSFARLVHEIDAGRQVVVKAQ